jgi:hypothetical protein
MFKLSNVYLRYFLINLLSNQNACVHLYYMQIKISKFKNFALLLFFKTQSDMLFVVCNIMEQH